MLLHHLLNLLRASSSVFFSTLGTTIVGFVAMLLDSLASIGISLWRILSKQGLEAARQHWRDTAKVALQTIFMVTITIYGSIFLYSIGRALYDDHEWQVGKRKELESRIPALESRIVELRGKLSETCYLPDRRLTQEQRDVLYRAFRELAEKTPRQYRRILVGSFRGDQESKRYMQTLHELIKNAGWDVGAPIDETGYAMQSNAGISYGMVILSAKDEATDIGKAQKEVALGIDRAFVSVNMAPNTLEVDSSYLLPKPRYPLIWIGFKPVN